MARNTKESRSHARWSLLLVAAGLACSDMPAAVDGVDAGGPQAASAPVASTSAGEQEATTTRAAVSEADARAAARGASGTVQRQLAELRRATARFHRASEAAAAGHSVLVTHPATGDACLEDPVLGGMGRHMLDPSLVDGQVEVSAPEVVIYEPSPGGTLRLVAVEYVIPFDIRGADEAPPVLFGQEFKQNHTFGLWALHAWPWKHNPSGMFADWNPTVSCAHDDAVVD